MAPTTGEKLPKGPPQRLISHISHLHRLLCNLPDLLPENPPHSLYWFHFDDDKLEDGSYSSAAGHALEVSFETSMLAIQGCPLLFME